MRMKTKQKRLKLLKANLQKSKKIQGDFSGELEHIKKTVRMLDSGSSKLDQIHMAMKIAGNQISLGYKGESPSTKTVFVPTTKVEKPDVN